MTIRRHTKRPGRSQPVSRRAHRWGPGAFGFSLFIGAVGVCALLVSCGDKTSPAPPAQATETNGPPRAGSVSPEFAKLAGKWERPDGGYVLEIKGVEAGGKMDAAYFNPEPIHVSKALALRDGGTVKVFIELDDVNYPGCTYSLAYEPQSDQLFGQYFQASMQRTFDIVFVRMK
jgi:hypothetical protein